MTGSKGLAPRSGILDLHGPREKSGGSFCPDLQLSPDRLIGCDEPSLRVVFVMLR